jgi:hypothetical protein
MSHMGEEKWAHVCMGSSKGKWPFGRPSHRGEMVLNWILKKWNGRAWMKLIWLRIGTCGVLLWVWYRTVGFQNIWGNSQLAEELVAFQEGLWYYECTVKFVMWCSGVQKRQLLYHHYFKILKYFLQSMAMGTQWLSSTSQKTGFPYHIPISHSHITFLCHIPTSHSSVTFSSNVPLSHPPVTFPHYISLLRSPITSPDTFPYHIPLLRSPITSPVTFPHYISLLRSPDTFPYHIPLLRSPITFPVTFPCYIPLSHHCHISYHIPLSCPYHIPHHIPLTTLQCACLTLTRVWFRHTEFLCFRVQQWVLMTVIQRWQQSLGVGWVRSGLVPIQVCRCLRAGLCCV